MIRRSLVLALAAAILPLATASAADLVQTYEMARTGDPQIAAAESTRLYDKEGRVQARALLLPQVSGSASWSRSHANNNGSGQHTLGRGRDYSINASQTLFNWAQYANLRAQRAISEAADYTLDSANKDLIVRTSTAYFSVLVAIESLSAANTNETAAKEQFDYASKRLEVGLAPITDVHEARAQYDGARASTILARNALEDAYQGLSELTGESIRNLKALPFDFKPELPLGRVKAEEWVVSAMDQNPALKASELQLKAAEENITIARAAHLPTLSLSGGWGDSTQWGDIRTTDSRNSSIGISLSVPIFTGGATQSKVRQALAQRDISQDGYEQQRRALERNTRNAYQTLVAGVSEVEARRSAVVSAQSAYEASQVGLEVGTRTVLDVVQNQRTLFSAQLEYVQSKYNFLQSRLLLSQAAGELDYAVLQDINRMLTDDIQAQTDTAIMR